MELSEKIRAARRATGYSQKTMATILGCNKSAIAQWELGNSKPSVEHLIDFAAATGQSLSYFDASATVNIGTVTAIDEGELALIRLWRRLNKQEQALWMKILLTAGAPKGEASGSKFNVGKKKSKDP